MAVQIKEYSPSSAKLKILIYGKSGTGKTTFGATAPSVLFVSSEAGLLSVADKKVNYAEINTLQDLRDVYEYLKKGDHKFETVVIDSLTDIQNHIINQITGGKRMPQKGEWSDFGFEMNKLLRLFRDLDMHVIFLALEKSIEGEESEVAMMMPDLYGSVRDKVGGYMDFVGRLALWSVQDENGAKSSKRGICFILNERFLAKARRGKFGAITEPDFKDILSVAVIEVGEEKVVTDVPSDAVEKGKVAQPAPVSVVFPPEQGDKIRSSAQSEEMMSLWDTLCACLKLPQEKREAMREKMLMKYCGAKSWNILREKQARSLIGELKKQVDIAMDKNEGKEEPKDVPAARSHMASPETQAAAHAAFGPEYSIEDDLKRRDELNELRREEVEAIADQHGIPNIARTKKPELIDLIMLHEMPNSPAARQPLSPAAHV